MTRSASRSENHAKEAVSNPTGSTRGIRAPFTTSVAQRAAIGSTAAAWP